MNLETICQEADRLVSNDRQDDYGHPIDDFSKVVGMAQALWGRGPETAEEHAVYMVLVKLAREANRPKRDNRVDAVGYLKTLDMVIEERDRREALKALEWPSPDEIVEELHALSPEADSSPVFERLKRANPERYRAEIEPYLLDLERAKHPRFVVRNP